MIDSPTMIGNLVMIEDVGMIDKVGRCDGGRQPQRQQLTLLGWDGREPFRRGDRPVRVQRLVRPVIVVVSHPGIDRRLGCLELGNGPVRSKKSGRRVRWKRSTLPFWFGEAGWVSRCRMPFLRQIRSNITSPPFPNRSVNCFPLSS